MEGAGLLLLEWACPCSWLRRHRRHLAAVALLSYGLLISGCASVEGVAITLDDQSQRKVEYVVAGSKSPVVVFENGLGGRLEWWSKIIPEISKQATVYAYNRAGIGASTPTTRPRDGLQVIEELRQNLRERKLPPPYILVGHSLGGLYMQLYMRRYPDEVAGLVLVDSTHPEQLTDKGSPSNWPAWFKVAFGVASSAAAKSELAYIPATGRELLALPTVQGKPVIVLSAQEPMQQQSDLARDANAKRADILRLNPGARQVWVNSGHAIPLENPDAVISAVQDVLAELRAREESRQ